MLVLSGMGRRSITMLRVELCLKNSTIFWCLRRLLTLYSQTQQVLLAFFVITPRACAKGKVVDLFPSVAKKFWRWRELAPSRTSELIWSFENTPILLTCTCYWAESLPLAAISAVFYYYYYYYYPVHFVSHFIYGHESRPQHIYHVFTITYIHVHAQHTI